MRQILDIRLTPEMVNTIKQVQDGCGVFLQDCTWQFESVGDIDKTETCYTFTDFKSAQLLKRAEEVQAEQTNESAIVESNS